MDLFIETGDLRFHPDFDPPFTVTQILELIEHRRRNPWGFWKVTPDGAHLLAAVLNAIRGKDSRYISSAEFLPKTKPKATDWDALKARMMRGAC